MKLAGYVGTEFGSQMGGIPGRRGGFGFGNVVAKTIVKHPRATSLDGFGGRRAGFGFGAIAHRGSRYRTGGVIEDILDKLKESAQAGEILPEAPDIIKMAATVARADELYIKLGAPIPKATSFVGESAVFEQIRAVEGRSIIPVDLANAIIDQMDEQNISRRVAAMRAVVEGRLPATSRQATRQVKVEEDLPRFEAQIDATLAALAQGATPQQAADKGMEAVPGPPIGTIVLAGGAIVIGGIILITIFRPFG